MPESFSWSSATRALPDDASELARGVPVEKSSTGTNSSARITRAAPPTSHRLRTTKRPHGTQPWPAFAVRRLTPIRSSRGPTVASTTGRRVIAISTLISGMSMPP